MDPIPPIGNRNSHFDVYLHICVIFYRFSFLLQKTRPNLKSIPKERLENLVLAIFLSEYLIGIEDVKDSKMTRRFPSLCYLHKKTGFLFTLHKGKREASFFRFMEKI